MPQSRRQSMYETITNTSIGFLGSWLITLGCLYLWTDPFVSATIATIGCTVYSLIRGYAIRRYFNNRITKEE